MGAGRGQARGQALAIRILDMAARTADNMMMIVPHPGFIQRHPPLGLDLLNDPGLGQGVEIVVYGLQCGGWNSLLDRRENRVRIGMRMIVQSLQHRQPHSGQAEFMVFEHMGKIDVHGGFITDQKIESINFSWASPALSQIFQPFTPSRPDPTS